MLPSRGIREQQARNEHAADLAAFTALLLEALDDPQVTSVLAERVFGHARDRARRNAPQLTVTSAGQARDLKASRLAARGRGSRG